MSHAYIIVYRVSILFIVFVMKSEFFAILRYVADQEAADILISDIAYMVSSGVAVYVNGTISHTGSNELFMHAILRTTSPEFVEAVSINPQFYGACIEMVGSSAMWRQMSKADGSYDDIDFCFGENPSRP